MGWELREIDVSDDVLMHRLYEIIRAAKLFERPDAPFWSERESTLAFRENDPSENFTAQGAFEGDELVGAAMFIMPLLDNREKAFVEIWVEPERRRRGIGTALADHLARLTASEGRTTLLAHASYPFEGRDDHPYRRFAEKNGYQLALTQIRRDLALPIADEQVQAWIDEAAPHHEGYRIECFEGLLPDELIDSFLYVYNQLTVDAPFGEESWEPEAMTPDVFKVRHRNNVEAQRRAYHTVAIDEASGAVVAYTTLAVSFDDAPNAHQWGTLVHRNHRGHRLGLAVKARALEWLQRNHPDRTRITTINAEVNAQMVGINERMGFQPIEILGEFQRILD